MSVSKVFATIASTAKALAPAVKSLQKQGVFSGIAKAAKGVLGSRQVTPSKKDSQLEEALKIQQKVFKEAIAESQKDAQCWRKSAYALGGGVLTIAAVATAVFLWRIRAANQ